MKGNNILQGHKFYLFFLFTFLITVNVKSQSLTGPYTVIVGETHTYGISVTVNDVLSWDAGIHGTSTPNGANHTTSINWILAGNHKLEALVETLNLNLIIVDQTITINSSANGNGTSASLSDENYIHSVIPKVAVTTISSNTPVAADLIESVTYFDGLGRLKQNVNIRAGGDSEDIIMHIGYDDFGRQTKGYLPYTSDTDIGNYRSTSEATTKIFYDATKYNEDFPGMSTSTINPYSEKSLEASPLNRVLEQGAPGADWLLNTASDTDHTIKFDYGTNTASEVKKFAVSLSFASNTYTPTLTGGSTYYSAGELYKSIVKDENWDPNQTYLNDHTTEEFKDRQGRVILKRTYKDNTEHDTYYIYDSYGNLSYVLPPKMDVKINTLSTINSKLNDLGYVYTYDHRSRLVEKKIPGKGWEYIVYNKLDQPVLTKDDILDADEKWLFTKYDAFGRVAYTGKVDLKVDRIGAQTYVNNASSTYVTKSSSPTTIAGTSVYYNNGAYPTSSIDYIYTIYYYDNYTFDKVSGSFESSYNITPITNVKGLATGSKVRVLGTNDWITNITYYDEKERPIYIYSHNALHNTTDKVKNQVDFTGNVLESTTTHSKTGESTITIVDSFTYDHMGRFLTQKNKINSQAKETLATNMYDELGQIVTKGVGGLSTNSRLQTVDYDYNIRGWLKNINDVDAIGNDLFAFKINYNTIDHHTGSNNKLYNGNISETEWRTNNTDTGLHWYKYEYDALNRITKATDDVNHYTLSTVAYDKNGNITTLARRGAIVANPVATTSNHFGKMDDLNYDYGTTNGNQLYKVREWENTTYGFKDSSVDDQDYWYDDNGNLIKDDNKGIISISYNYLNLPTQVTFASGNIQYIYDATGVKQKKIVSTGNTTLYAGNFIYEDNGTIEELKFFNHAEGYVEPDGSSFDYVYQYKDHLGNIRLSYHDTNGNGSITTSEIREEHNYYPFGLKHKGYNTDINGTHHKYMFGGKELQNDVVGGNSFEMYDYGARNYDASLGRWMNLDPMAEKYYGYSTYNYTINNPILFVDPDGRSVSFSGNSNDVWKIINGLLSTFGDGKLTVNFNHDKDGNVTGFTATEYQADKENEINQFLETVINSKENIEIKRVKTTPKQVDPIEFKAGMSFYTEKGKTKGYIGISDSYFEDGFNRQFGGGRHPIYFYKVENNSWLMDPDYYSRKIPFEEGLAHEIIHAARWISRKMASNVRIEENFAKNMMNTWRDKRNIPKRPTSEETPWYKVWVPFQPSIYEKLYFYEKN